MKKKQYIKIACLSLLSLMATSCLDLEPKAELNDAIVWNKASNFQLFANQFYTWTRDFHSSNTYMCSTSDGPHSDWRSDLIAGASVNTYSKGTNSIPAKDDNYTKLYTQIYYTNLLLDKAESFADGASIAVPVAEAKFFRAYCYFELVQIFGNVILVTKPLDLNSPELQTTRDDRAVVIDQIVKDLTESVNGLPETAETGRVTKDAAWAMLSRVALYEGTWQKFHTNGSNATTNTERSAALLKIAKDAAYKVIDGKRFKLFYNDKLGVESYRYMFILEDVDCNPAHLIKSNNTEYILARRHRIEDGIGTNITKGYLANATFVTRKWANMYLCSDGLPIEKSPLFKKYVGVTDEFQNRDNRMTTTLMQHGEKYWNNTTNNSRKTWDDQDLATALTLSVTSNSGYQNHKWAVERLVADTQESMDYPVIRYAEVLLNYAEATYELDGAISNTDLDLSLNLVRLRINSTMPKLSNSFVTTNGLSMREEIRRERTLELVLEGFRIDDLKRWATAPKEMVEDQLGVKYTGTWFESHWANQSRSLNSDGCIVLYDGRVWSDKLYLYPLPSDQLQLNPQLGQNPGWTE
ncbi:RagB/SusD family nutrient uptake outer membrane protein [Bacteroides sp. GM023]|uniref:RagB/SusD family nutrient uptake outer membrane protein n=1 Tax=Bacteroides sp. GM023 TaxID=2723058 RepID=UPI00168B070B|nr:RagB/SusD family nutrient uptake outer membrane protein [Bacteroides sp. GM023]MBD3590012.1 RagB/SusD family nutrient uptake outer membrane protein [Bacteroides sp. GM023]